MSSERKIIAAAIKEREAFETLEQHIREGDFTESARTVWDGLREFYTRDGSARSCDPEILVREICRKLQSPKHRETFESLIRDLSQSEVSSKNVVHDFLSVRRDAVGSRLATLLAAGKFGKDVESTLEEYKIWQNANGLDPKESNQILRGMPLAEITKTYNPDELIKVWPTALNNRLDGGVLRGHHMVVFARPEMGKTLFLVNAVAGFLAQGLIVLYVGNEDPIYDIAMRVVCRLTKKDRYQVLADPETADREAQSLGYSNLILASLAPGTVAEMEALIEEYKPDVLLIDQLRNISIGGKDSGYTQQLEKAATAARNLGKRHGIFVISVTQAGDSASGKAVLEIGDVDSSNTGIPAQADIMVGIGATQEDQQMGRRVLSLPKNKRSGKHEYFPVRFDTQTSRIINIEEM